MYSYPLPITPKHETELQHRRHELRLEDQKLAQLKKALRAMIESGPKQSPGLRAA